MGESNRWTARLEEAGALTSGHFLLSSGRHSARYVQCAKLLERPAMAGEVGAALAAQLPKGIERIVSPPLGALLIGYEVARALDVPFLFPERDGDGRWSLRRGFAVPSGERIAVVEDVITTGRTTGEVVDLLEEAGGQVLAVGAIVDRSTDHMVRGREIVSVLRMTIPTFEPSRCPLCARGVPVRKPGSRPTLEGGA